MANKEQCKECKFCSMMSHDLGVGRLHVFCEYQEMSLTPDGSECDDFEQKKYEDSCWNADGSFKTECYWKLRQQVTIGSCFMSSYENSYGLDPHRVSDFFEAYELFIDERILDNHGDKEWDRNYEPLFEKYDTEATLLEFVNNDPEHRLTNEMLRGYTS